MALKRDHTSAQATGEETSWLPLLTASAGTAVVTFLTQMLATAWAASQQGATVELRFWYFVPILQIRVAQLSQFSAIAAWAAVATAVVATLWAGSALIANRLSLQTQAGRSFGFLNVFLVGFLDWWSPISDEASMGGRAQAYLMLYGLLFFFTAAGLIVRDRLREIEPAGASQGEVYRYAR